MGYRDRITIEAGKRGGNPCIRGMRITVYDVLDSSLLSKAKRYGHHWFTRLEQEQS